jgi:hypothetical protein
MSDAAFFLGKLGELAKTGVSVITRSQSQQQTTRQVRKSAKGCTPCAAKAQAAAARARVAQGKL